MSEEGEAEEPEKKVTKVGRFAIRAVPPKEPRPDSLTIPLSPPPKDPPSPLLANVNPAMVQYQARVHSPLSTSPLAAKHVLHDPRLIDLSQSCEYENEDWIEQFVSDCCFFAHHFPLDRHAYVSQMHDGMMDSKRAIEHKCLHYNDVIRNDCAISGILRSAARAVMNTVQSTSSAPVPSLASWKDELRLRIRSEEQALRPDNGLLIWDGDIDDLMANTISDGDSVQNEWKRLLEKRKMLLESDYEEVLQWFVYWRKMTYICKEMDHIDFTVTELQNLARHGRVFIEEIRLAAIRKIDCPMEEEDDEEMDEVDAPSSDVEEKHDVGEEERVYTLKEIERNATSVVARCSAFPISNIIVAVRPDALASFFEEPLFSKVTEHVLTQMRCHYEGVQTVTVSRKDARGSKDVIPLVPTMFEEKVKSLARAVSRVNYAVEDLEELLCDEPEPDVPDEEENNGYTLDASSKVLGTIKEEEDDVIIDDIEVPEAEPEEEKRQCLHLSDLRFEALRRAFGHKHFAFKGEGLLEPPRGQGVITHAKIEMKYREGTANGCDYIELCGGLFRLKIDDDNNPPYNFFSFGLDDGEDS